MIGKLIAYGHNRNVVIRKLDNALEGLIIEGLKTNIPLHKVIMKENNFKSGHYTTNYIAEVSPQEGVEETKKVESLFKKAIAIEMKALQEGRER